MMPTHALSHSTAPMKRKRKPRPPRSPSSSSDSTAEYKWNAFEMRAIFCLIIKGEHLDTTRSGGPISDMDFASKLNKALNPAKTTTATTKNDKSVYDRDIPVADVAEMLRRVLAKKRHAVDVVTRNPAAAVTRRQIAAFTRQLDFDGSVEEWVDRRDVVLRERAELRHQLEKHTNNEDEDRTYRSISPDRAEENRRRLQEIRSYRAEKLLAKWAMGHTFFEGPAEPAWQTAAKLRGLPMASDYDDDSRSADAYSTNSVVTTTASFNTRSRGSDQARNLDDPFVSGGHTPAWATVQTPAWGRPFSYTGAATPNIGAATPNVGAATPNVGAATPTPAVGGGWGGGFGQSSTFPLPNTGGYGGYGAAATASHSSASIAPVPAYGGGYGAAGPMAQHGAQTPAYGNGYGSARVSVRGGAPPPAYRTGYGAMSPPAQPCAPVLDYGSATTTNVPVPSPAFGNGYGGMSPSVQSTARTPAYGNGYGAGSNPVRSSVPTPAYGNGYGGINNPAQPLTTTATSSDGFQGGQGSSMPPPRTNGQMVDVPKKRGRKAQEDEHAKR